MASWFARMSKRVAWWSGNYRTFVGAVAIVLVWAATGPLFGFTDTWQLVINTGTTVRHLLDGLPDPEHTEPRRPPQAY